MSAKTDSPSSGSGGGASRDASADTPATASSASGPSASANFSGRKPRISLFIATACGLGYLPKAPGTWGSLAGLALETLPWWLFVSAATILSGRHLGSIVSSPGRFWNDPFFLAQCGLTAIVAVAGVFSANRAAKFWALKDPQRVVIDEVSGQHLTLLFGCILPVSTAGQVWTSPFPFGLIAFDRALNWKYLVLGFILFRVFDIWKPFPARQAESLPGGWGIMADDWIAAIYAGLGLWLARALGL
ncbi:MAG TPA: phosphatidylglycerophosphatase A [Candidatus Acidoferrales bacterium]|nr:phosphatidylglycerophosphatase A [Candidatus Acidoferrales bacterium]